MRLNDRILSTSMIFAATALFTVSSAMAQTAPGGGAPQQSPSQQNPATTQPGMSPLDQAQATANSQDPNSPTMMMDKSFVRKALQGGMAEVQLGQLALQKSNNGDVKQFAQKMVDDHTKLGDQMKQVAEQMNVKPPDSVSSKDKATMAKLEKLNGDSFDKAYIQDMVKDHKQDEKDFKQEARNATNPNLKQAAAQGAQVIGEHLQMIEQIAQKNNVAEK